MDGILHINANRFDDLSGSRKATVRAAALRFTKLVAEELGHVDPPNGAMAVTLVEETVLKLVETLFPAVPMDAPAPAAPPPADDFEED